ncbi:ABC transporter ATP-binding protein [Myxococcota bacterium]|nr:ABC transporter ATP-binding protein [Myxococcota bacterium]
MKDAARAEPGDAKARAGEPVIRVEDLYKSFGDNAVLKGINLDFPAGTTTVILGGSGSGKSVLMKHLIGLLEPDRGRILVDGEDIAGMQGEKLNTLRSKFGMVFQWAALFDSMTVGDNVAFPLREHKRELGEKEIMRRVAEKLALFGLEGIEEKYPADLSGGMRKRVGLARAIIMEPKIVLYDEPTTGLDPITTDYVDEMIKRAKEKLGVTSVVISHDIASAFNIADYIAFLYEGEIVSYGPPAHVKASEHDFVQKFLGTWFRKN